MVIVQIIKHAEFESPKELDERIKLFRSLGYKRFGALDGKWEDSYTIMHRFVELKEGDFQL